MPRLLELIDIVHEVYDVEHLGGIYAFLDGFSGEKKTDAGLCRTSQSGMKRIYIGMESGNASATEIEKTWASRKMWFKPYKPSKPAGFR